MLTTIHATYPNVAFPYLTEALTSEVWPTPSGWCVLVTVRRPDCTRLVFQARASKQTRESAEDLAERWVAEARTWLEIDTVTALRREAQRMGQEALVEYNEVVARGKARRGKSLNDWADALERLQAEDDPRA